jgi:hypothetical protein
LTAENFEKNAGEIHEVKANFEKFTEIDETLS